MCIKDLLCKSSAIEIKVDLLGNTGVFDASLFFCDVNI